MKNAGTLHTLFITTSLPTTFFFPSLTIPSLTQSSSFPPPFSFLKRLYLTLLSSRPFPPHLPSTPLPCPTSPYKTPCWHFPHTEPHASFLPPKHPLTVTLARKTWTILIHPDASRSTRGREERKWETKEWKRIGEGGWGWGRGGEEGKKDREGKVVRQFGRGEREWKGEWEGDGTCVGSNMKLWKGDDRFGERLSVGETSGEGMEGGREKGK